MAHLVDAAPVSHPVSEVGEGFQRVPAYTLLEFNDEVQDDRGRFCPVALEQVGRQVEPHMLARRIRRAANCY